MLRLRHPNLVGLLHVITTDEPRALVLEYMSQGSLADWLRRRRHPENVDLLHILHQVACGMAVLAARHIGRWGARRGGGERED